jgi:LPS-assembly lipoprotein
MLLARHIIFILGLLSLLSACGFQLRGSGGSALPESWHDMYLVTGNPNSELSREIESSFAASGVNWVAQENAAYIVKVGAEKFAQRNLSLNAQARAADFELTLSTHFTVTDSQGKEVMEKGEVSVIRQMENDPRNVVGKAEETRILRSEMRSDLVRKIMRGIAFYAASTQ